MVWFDAFRRDFGPTWYGDNRTAVITDTTTLTIFLVFAIFLIAFLIIFPGIRRERWSSFFSVTLSLAVGAILLATIYYPCWHIGYVRIYSTYRAFSSEKLDAILGVKIGLRHVNITLRGSPEAKVHHHLDYNERFHFDEVKSMERELQEGLQKGLPYPILSVIEYLSVDRAGFIWGRQYRLSGYYTNILLWFSFSLWILQFLMICLVPQYFSRSMLLLGGSIILADVVYVLACPKKLAISFPAVNGSITILDFKFGWCFWATIVSGVVCMLLGGVIRVLEAKSAYHFVTFLQADYDEVSASPRRPTRTGLGSSRNSLGSDFQLEHSITSDQFVEGIVPNTNNNLTEKSPTSFRTARDETQPNLTGSRKFFQSSTKALRFSSSDSIEMNALEGTISHKPRSRPHSLHAAQVAEEPLSEEFAQEPACYIHNSGILDLSTTEAMAPPLSAARGDTAPFGAVRDMTHRGVSPSFSSPTIPLPPTNRYNQDTSDNSRPRRSRALTVAGEQLFISGNLEEQLQRKRLGLRRVAPSPSSGEVERLPYHPSQRLAQPLHRQRSFSLSRPDTETRDRLAPYRAV